MKKETAKILSQNKIADGIYSMWIETSAAKEAKPGQFIDVYVNDDSKLLPRPISICEVKDNSLRIVYRVVGGGTKIMSTYQEGDEIQIIGPLGNGFDMRDGKAILVGGGIGIPPMVKLAKNLSEKIGKENVISVMGYRNELFLVDELEQFSTVVIATEDGSTGTKGTVIDALNENGVDGDALYACGPIPMLNALKDWTNSKDIKCQISLEERMACGIGACLACVCKTKEKDEHSNVCNKRICKDGPVFDANEIVF